MGACVSNKKELSQNNRTNNKNNNNLIKMSLTKNESKSINSCVPSSHNIDSQRLSKHSNVSNTNETAQPKQNESRPTKQHNVNNNTNISHNSTDNKGRKNNHFSKPTEQDEQPLSPIEQLFTFDSPFNSSTANDTSAHISTYLNKYYFNFNHKNHTFSTIDHYNQIINANVSNKYTTACKLLQLNERSWYKEKVSLSNRFSKDRDNSSNDQLNLFLQHTIKQHEHFNWISYSLSLYCYFNYFNKNNTKCSFFRDALKFNLPPITEGHKWYEGFQWKGLYVKLIQPYCYEATIIKEEIKALNYAFFDYIQILNNVIIEDSALILSNEIIFPLISCIEIANMVLVVSAQARVKNAEAYADITKYTTTDLNESRIFRSIEGTNLIQLELYSSSRGSSSSQKHKYFLTNVSHLIPKLFGIDMNPNHNCRHLKLFPIFKCGECQYTTMYNINPSTVINDVYNNKNIPISAINAYNTLHNGIQYKLLYTNGNKECFITNGSEKKITVNEHIIVFRFVKEIKLKYSLINYIPSKNQNNKYVYDNISHFQMKYISHFDSWCKLHSTSNQNILSVHSLKQNAHRYGVNMSMMYFALINITNNVNISSYAVNIADIITLYIFVSILKHIYNEQSTLLTKDAAVNKIYNMIHMILYPTIFKQSDKNGTAMRNFYRQMRHYLQLKYMKWYLIDEYLQLGVFKNNRTSDSDNEAVAALKNPKSFLEQMISTARRKAFLFLSTLETRLCCSIDPYIKYISSISLESLQNKITTNHIHISLPYVHTYIIPHEINSYLFARAIMSVNMYDTFETNFSSFPLLNMHSNINSSNSNIIKHNLNKKIFTTNKNQHDDHNESSLTCNYNNQLNTNINTNTNMNNITCNIPPSDTESSFNGDHTPKPLTVYKNKTTIERISDKLTVTLSPICYKQKFIYNETNKKESYCLNKIYSYLNNYYCIKNVDTVHKWLESSQKVFNGIHSYNCAIENEMIRVYITWFFFMYKVKKDKHTSEHILSNIKDIIAEYHNHSSNNNEYSISYQLLAVLQLLLGDIKDGFISKEQFYSRAVILSVLAYGDPRGKYNDGCGFMLYPLWYISRQVCTLENINVLSEYFKEMFHCQDYFTKLNYHGGFSVYRGGSFGIKAQQIRNVMFNRSVDYVNNQNANCKKFIHLYNNELNLFRRVSESCNLMVDIDEDISSHMNMGVNINSELDLIFTLSESNYSDTISKASPIKPFTFRNITDKAIELNEESFKSDEFIIYLYKHIQLFITEGFANNNSATPHNALLPLYNEMLALNVHKPQCKSNDNKKFGKYCILSHYVHDILYEKLSYKKYIPSGTVIAFGRNNYNETTHDNYAMLDLPRVVYKLKNEHIVNIKSGWEHNVAIDKYGNVFTWGNNTVCQCGIEPSEKNQYTIKISTPINLSAIHKGLTVIDSSCGNEHTLFLHRNNNKIYGIGNNMDGVLGQSDLELKTHEPVEIDIPLSYGKVIAISSGTVHNVALTSKGLVFAWGSAQGGQLGLSEKQMMAVPNFTQSYCICKPTHIAQLSNVIAISTGEAHSVALCSSGRVYAWGFGSNGQLGLGFCEDSFEPGTGLTKSRILLPQMVHTFTEEVKEIQCGKTFTMMITKNNQLYGCGVNDLYQLGLSYAPENKLFHPDMKCDDFTLPTVIESIPFTVETIACGEGHCLAVLKGNGGLNLWSWGNNQWGQLGIGLESGIKKSLPKPIAWMLNENEWVVEKVSCGGFHSLCVVKRKEEKDLEEEDVKEIVVLIRDATLDWE